MVGGTGLALTTFVRLLFLVWVRRVTFVVRAFLLRCFDLERWASSSVIDRKAMQNAKNMVSFLMIYQF
jgi:hypothetical protein